MTRDHSPSFFGGSSDFPTTHWSMLRAVDGEMTETQREVLNYLIQRYWKPVYVYICCRGQASDAPDLAQDFFVHCLSRELFGRAEQARGRFRSFLLSCLKNFLSDARRFQQRHGPPQGFVSIHQLAEDEDLRIEPVHRETAEHLFLQTWVRELLERVWGTLQDEFQASGREVHCKLFRCRVLEPAFTDSPPRPLQQLAEESGLTYKQASNCVITATRAFQRLLRQEVSVYASSESEIAAEIRELTRVASGP